MEREAWRKYSVISGMVELGMSMFLTHGERGRALRGWYSTYTRSKAGAGSSSRFQRFMARPLFTLARGPAEADNMHL